LKRLVDQHDIQPAEAPIKGRDKRVYDTALIDHIGREEVATVADIGGQARGFALSAFSKFDCDLILVDVDEEGNVPEKPSDWVDDYLAFLSDNGVPEDRVTVIKDLRKLRPVDVLLNLQGFGDRHKVKFLKPFLEKMVHSDTRLFMDIKKGSGAFPFLKDYGTNEKLSEHTSSGKPVTRVVVTPKPPEGGDDAAWDDIAMRLAGDDGFYRPGPEGHSFLFMPRSDDTLVVTFDNLDITMNKRDDRRPWGYSFIKEQGWSMLGVLAGGWTWYRNPWVSEQFDELRDSGFFNRFKRVVFYGASMGGYAACAFSAAAPGADVVAISPQSTLDKSIVPWETRYKVAWDRDFSGTYGDAAHASAAANKVYILYDPYEPLDSGHVARFENDNVERLRAPLLGHRLGSSLNQMGILSPIILGALSGTLTSQDYYQMLRTRKTFPRYQRELFSRAVDKGHKQLAKNLGEYILARNDNRKVRLGLQGL
jgi:pimeloyl-ACP methyl ester carboxylesterase